MPSTRTILHVLTRSTTKTCSGYRQPTNYLHMYETNFTYLYVVFGKENNRKHLFDCLSHLVSIKRTENRKKTVNKEGIHPISNTNTTKHNKRINVFCLI